MTDLSVPSPCAKVCLRPCCWAERSRAAAMGWCRLCRPAGLSKAELTTTCRQGPVLRKSTQPLCLSCSLTAR